MRVLISILTLALSLNAIVYTGFAQAAQKIAGEDERIKTLVYDPSEVYRVVSRAGFQTTIEFANDETVDTISIGDSIGWQLTPAGKRLFLKPLHKSGITNLSVFTNRRSYQFELVATSSTSMSSSHSYIVKFFYPEAVSSAPMQIMPQEQTRGGLRGVSPTPIPMVPTPYIPPAPTLSAPLPGESAASSPFPAAPLAPNYNYTMTGPESIAPLKIYDNGRSTFFQLPGSIKNPQISAIGANNQEYPLSVRFENGMAVVDTVAPKYSIRQGRETVTVYNESKPVGY